MTNLSTSETISSIAAIVVVIVVAIVYYITEGDSDINDY